MFTGLCGEFAPVAPVCFLLQFISRRLTTAISTTYRICSSAPVAPIYRYISGALERSSFIYIYSERLNSRRIDRLSRSSASSFAVAIFGHGYFAFTD